MQKLDEPIWRVMCLIDEDGGDLAAAAIVLKVTMLVCNPDRGAKTSRRATYALRAVYHVVARYNPNLSLWPSIVGEERIDHFTQVVHKAHCKTKDNNNLVG